jgi:hypothetical protein
VLVISRWLPPRGHDRRSECFLDRSYGSFQNSKAAVLSECTESDLQPKETRLVSYAVDLGTEVVPEVKEDASICRFADSRPSAGFG